MTDNQAKQFLAKMQGRVVVNSSYTYSRIIGLTEDLQYVLLELISAAKRMELQPRAVGYISPASIVESVTNWRFGKWLLI